MTIAEFFVMEKYRRQGSGTRVATHLFDRFPSRWEVAQLVNNISAQSPVSPFPGQAFWRFVIDQYCGGNYEEIELDNEVWKGPVEVFDNSVLRQG